MLHHNNHEVTTSQISHAYIFSVILSDGNSSTCTVICVCFNSADCYMMLSDLCGGSDLLQPFVSSVSDDGRDEAAGRCHGDRDVDGVQRLRPVSGPHHIHLRHLLQDTRKPCFTREHRLIAGNM